jgi:tetratricopeptide (TPR) repeat protein
MDVGGLTEAEQAVGASLRWAADAGQPALRFWPAWIDSGVTLAQGRLEEAERKVATILEVGRLASHPDTRIYHSIHEFALRFEQQRLADVEAAVQALVAELPGVALFRSMLALLYSESGRAEAARAVLEEALGPGPIDAESDSTRFGSVCILTDVACRLGDASTASRCAAAIADYPEQMAIVAGVVYGVVSHHLAMADTLLRRWDDAEARFRQAEMIHRKAGMPRWLGRTLREWTQLLILRNGPGDSQRAERFQREAAVLLGQEPSRDQGKP